MKKQNDASIENTISIYQNDLSHKLNAVTHFVNWTVVHDQTLDEFSSDKHMGDYSQASIDLRSRVADTQYATGVEFQYFFVACVV